MSSCSRLLLTLILVIIPNISRADGIAFSPSSRAPLMEREQRAAISYRDGIEKMVISINLDMKDSDSAVWIFPVPGTPDRTKVDVVDTFPRFYGREARAEASSAIGDVMMFARFTQLWPTLAELVFPPTMGIKSLGVSPLAQVDKYGLHTEAITVESPEALQAYLQKKAVVVHKEQLDGFEPYFNKPHVFVVTWIASINEVRKTFPETEERRLVEGRWPCVYVEFPTDRAFYPLRPSRSYGKASMPVRLFVLGYVQPETRLTAADKLKVSYGIRHRSEEEAPSRFTEDMTGQAVAYTAVSINIPAQSFDDDLWFSPRQSPSLGYAAFVNSLDERIYLGVAGLVLITALLSYLSAGLAARSMSRKWGPFAPFGLLNLLTVVALMLFIRFVPLTAAKDIRKEKWKFWRRFTLIYVGLTILLQIALTIPLSL